MDQYWNRWAKELRTLTEPYEGMYDPRISSEFPEEHLLKYYKCLNRLMQPLELLEENLECPGEMLLENYAHLEENLESLATKHPWFSEDKSTQDVIELLEVLTARREIKKEFFEEKMTGLDKRINELKAKMRSRM